LTRAGAPRYSPSEEALDVVRILDPAPDFKARAATGPRPADVRDVSLADHRGRFLVLFFYPRDFTAVCPTEVLEFSKRAREFRDVGADLLGASVDDVETHQRWIAEKLGPLAFPLLADPTKEVARAYGALLEREGVATRATFVVDSSGIVQYAAFHNLDVGRSPSETLRVVEALRTGAPSPAEWHRGGPTLGR
jgi:alkyl hydroperoxide reductase subunit AhpC